MRQESTLAGRLPQRRDTNPGDQSYDNSPLLKVGGSLNSGTLKIAPSESQKSTIVMNVNNSTLRFLGDNLSNSKQKRLESESTRNLHVLKSDKSGSLEEMRANTMPKTYLRNYNQRFSDSK